MPLELSQIPLSLSLPFHWTSVLSNPHGKSLHFYNYKYLFDIRKNSVTNRYKFNNKTAVTMNVEQLSSVQGNVISWSTLSIYIEGQAQFDK
jgi:hypothetical protein